MRMAILVFLSAAVNMRLKLAFAQPRPYDLEPALGLAREKTFGLPSGHAQAAVAFWGSAARVLRAPLGSILAVALPIAIGFSRVYLGVHFPTDVLAGWAIGAMLLLLDRFIGDGIGRFVSRLRERLALAVVAAVSMAMFLLSGRDTALSGAFFGMAGSAIYWRRLAPYSVAGSPRRRALRYLLGMATVAAVYGVLKLSLAGIEEGGPPLVRFARFAIVGAWIAVGAPWLFLKVRLADPEPEDHSAKEKEGSVILK